MIRWARLAVAAAVAACAGACLFPDLSALDGDGGITPDGQSAADSGDAAIPDAGTDGDAATPVCDPSKPFTSIAPIAELNDGYDQYKLTLTPDELEVWYGLTQQTDAGSIIHIMHAKRSDRGSKFGAPAVEANIAEGDVDPGVSDDGLLLYYAKFGTVGDWDLFQATRATRSDPFGLGAQLPPSIQSTTSDVAPFVAFDQSLYFASRRTAGGYDIWHAPMVDGGLGAPVVVPELSSTSADEEGVVLTHDGLWAYVTSNRTDLPHAGSWDVFLASRTSTSATFGALTNAGELNTTSGDRANWISWDNCRMYFESTRSGSSDLFVATKLP